MNSLTYVGSQLKLMNRLTENNNYPKDKGRKLFQCYQVETSCLFFTKLPLYTLYELFIQIIGPFGSSRITLICLVTRKNSFFHK